MIYLSGANGFIGKKIILYAQSLSIDIKILIYCPITNSWDGLSEINNGDLVIHAGAHSARNAVESDLLSKNVLATFLLARAIRSTKARLIFLSAASVTPKKAFDLITSQTEPDPLDAYSWSKFASESIIKEFIDSKNRIIIRLPAIYSNNLQGFGLLHKWLLQSRDSGVIKIDGIETRLNCFYTADLLVKFIFSLISNYVGRDNLIYIGCEYSATIFEIANYFSRYSISTIEMPKIDLTGNYLFDLTDALSLGMISISVFDVIDHFFMDSSHNV